MRQPVPCYSRDDIGSCIYPSYPIIYEVGIAQVALRIDHEARRIVEFGRLGRPAISMKSPFLL